MAWVCGSRSDGLHNEASLTIASGHFAVAEYPFRICAMPVAMTILLRLFAWLLAAAVAFATLGPPRYRPHADLGQSGEHALAFVLVGLAFGLAYTRNRLPMAFIAVAMTGAIEIMQFWAPGRHARWSDFVVDSLALCAGLAAAAALDWAIKRARLQASQ
jgi:VanZ family protein